VIAIENLLTPVTSDEQLESFLSTLEGLGLRARSWRPGGALRTILRVVAGTYAGFSTVALGFARAGFLETAEKGWLTLLARNVFSVERIEASFATGTVRLQNSGGGIYELAPGELRAIHSATEKAYANVDAIVLNPGTVLSAVPVRAVELGSASNAGPGTVVELETALPGVTVTNPTAIVGRDEESDPELRERCRAKLGTISGKGPRGAYAFAVRSAKRDDGSSVDINRLRISPSSSTGTVTTYVASASGAPLAGDLDFVRSSIERYARPDSVTSVVLAATPVPLTRTLTVFARKQDGLSAADLRALVDARLLELITSYPIGGIAKPGNAQAYLYADAVAAAVGRAHASIFDVDGTGADVAMNAGDVVTLATTLDIRLVEVQS